jgi:hypothetical protein
MSPVESRVRVLYDSQEPPHYDDVASSQPDRPCFAREPTIKNINNSSTGSRAPPAPKPSVFFNLRKDAFFYPGGRCCFAP